MTLPKFSVILFMSMLVIAGSTFNFFAVRDVQTRLYWLEHPISGVKNVSTNPTGACIEFEERRFNTFTNTLWMCESVWRTIPLPPTTKFNWPIDNTPRTVKP